MSQAIILWQIAVAQLGTSKMNLIDFNDFFYQVVHHYRPLQKFGSAFRNLDIEDNDKQGFIAKHPETGYSFSYNLKGKKIWRVDYCRGVFGRGETLDEAHEAEADNYSVSPKFE